MCSSPAVGKGVAGGQVVRNSSGLISAPCLTATCMPQHPPALHSACFRCCLHAPVPPPPTVCCYHCLCALAAAALPLPSLFCPPPPCLQPLAHVLPQPLSLTTSGSFSLLPRFIFHLQHCSSPVPGRGMENMVALTSAWPLGSEPGLEVLLPGWAWPEQPCAPCRRPDSCLSHSKRWGQV